MLFGPPWKGVNVGNSTSVGLRASHGAPCGYSVVTAVLPVGHGYCWPRPEGPSRMPARQAGPSEDEPTAPPYTLFEAAPGLVRRGAHAGALPLNAGGRHHGCREPPAAGGDRNATMPQVGGSPCLSSATLGRADTRADANAPAMISPITAGWPKDLKAMPTKRQTNMMTAKSKKTQAASSSTSKDGGGGLAAGGGAGEVAFWAPAAPRSALSRRKRSGRWAPKRGRLAVSNNGGQHEAPPMRVPRANSAAAPTAPWRERSICDAFGDAFSGATLACCATASPPPCHIAT